MHLSEDTVDHYAMDRLTEPDLVIVEEHLLVCEQCRADIESVELMIAALHDVPTEIGTVKTHIVLGDANFIGTADLLRRVVMLHW